jgi:hypothetical protein
VISHRGVKKVIVISTEIELKCLQQRLYEQAFCAYSSLLAFSEPFLIRTGQESRSESLFYYFRLEDQVPET